MTATAGARMLGRLRDLAEALQAGEDALRVAESLGVHVITIPDDAEPHRVEEFADEAAAAEYMRQFVGTSTWVVAIRGARLPIIAGNRWTLQLGSRAVPITEDQASDQHRGCFMRQAPQALENFAPNSETVTDAPAADPAGSDEASTAPFGVYNATAPPSDEDAVDDDDIEAI